MSAVAVVALLVAAVYAGGGWYLSGLIGDRLSASARLQAFDAHSYVLRVAELDASGNPLTGRITLQVPAGQREVVTDGVWGVRAPDGGFGQIGRITARSSDQVTREFHQLTGPPIRAGEKLELVNDSFPEDPTAALGIPYTNVSYQGPLGSYPAWFIAGTQPDWAILVHGDAMHRQDTLEVMGPIFKAGLPMLVITYRNDPGAPAAPDGLLREGATEWQDLQAAVSYALDHGAHNVVLVGRSMGGAVVLSFLERSELANRVRAVILDAPMSSFSKAIDYAAAHFQLPLGLTVPRSLVAWTKWIASERYGVNWAAIDYQAQDSRLKAPILLFQGGADELVPQSMSDQLAADRPDLITYVVTPGAGHLDSWNLDPDRYERYVEDFIAEHGGG
ncbi:MAG TPA: alpha/beta fold hydrolase [Candidatus Dormibacteraeota bacterium]|nr:alpha/beta fold hydrolase [Candidatus Dormibacteraeota bacterium]